MNAVILKEITLESRAQSDHLLEETAHLILELNLRGQVVDRANLLARESRPSTWDADQILILHEVEEQFTLSVFLEVGGEDRHLLGHMELSGPALCDQMGGEIEVPLMAGEVMVLKTKVEAMSMADALNVVLAREQADNQAKKQAELEIYCTKAFNQIYNYEQTGNLDSLERAISGLQLAAEVVSKDDPKRRLILDRLGVYFRHRFQHLGRIEDLEDSTAQARAAVDLTLNCDPDKPTLMNNLGISLQTRFRYFRIVDDIENAIVLQQAAVDLAPNDDPHKLCLLSSLGNSLSTRFEYSGNTKDIDSAIVQQQAAVDLAPDDHPHKPSLLENLGFSLAIRFKRFWNIKDIDDAIARHQAAVDLTPDGHPHKPGRLCNLGHSLGPRFQRFGNIKDIDSAIVQQQAAVDLTPDGHPHKPNQLDNLGVSLAIRFERFGNTKDIDNAIARHQAAVDLTPEGHPEKPDRLSNLGCSLGTRFNHFRNEKDIENAIVQLNAAVDLTPDGHSNKSHQLLNLGICFLVRFLKFHNQNDAEAAISHLSSAAASPIGSPSTRLIAAKNGFAQHPSSNTHPYWMPSSHLVQTSSIARDATAAAISLQQYDKAVEWLEQGRSIVWTQILQLRTPVDQLHNVDPDLATNLLRVSRLLDNGFQKSGPHDQGKLSREEEGRRYRALAGEWEKIVDRIRNLPEFQDFLRPPRFSRLVRAATNGPVVMLNLASKRCDALILVEGLDEPMHIPLPDMTLEKANNLQVDLTALLKSSDLRTRAIREPEYEDGGVGETRRILSELWKCVVKPVLDSLAFSFRPERLPRIWWCVTGPLAFLPIHAAGNYDEGSTDGTIFDYVISSYTPTLTALLESPRSEADTPFKMLSVIEPSTGRYYIPNTKVELERIQNHLKDRDHFVLLGPDATKERVIDAMKDRQWIHLACHGSQMVDHPTKSALKLRDSDLLLEEIIKLDLPQAEFAFLSACQTVTGDAKLTDEAAHIAGGMLLAGYRSVVATMWSIQDNLAPEVADEFYRYLMEDGGRPDSRKTAEALHFSVQKLRKKPKIRMVDWIPFVHIGL